MPDEEHRLCQHTIQVMFIGRQLKKVYELRLKNHADQLISFLFMMRFSAKNNVSD